MSDDYITPACLLYRCGDREGNLEQCQALATEIEVDDDGNIIVVRNLDEDEVDKIIDLVKLENWIDRNCDNCALCIGNYCPTHGRVGVRDMDLSYCYHRHPAELGGKRVNEKVLLRWARYCASRASIHAMTAAAACADAADARVADARVADARSATRAARAAHAADAYVAAAYADAAGDEWLHCARVLWRWISKWGDDDE